MQLEKGKFVIVLIEETIHATIHANLNVYHFK